MPPLRLHWLDLAILLAYLAAILSIGFRGFRRNKSASEYFAGNRRIPAWAIAISIVATLISSVTFLAYPGAAYDKNWLLLVQGLMAVPVLLAIIWFIVPIYRRSIGISAYEYFEHRFGYSARLYASLVFSAMHFTKMGTVIYLLAAALAGLTGAHPANIVLVVGTATILYTVVGGIEAIIWVDVLQGFLFLTGGLICVAVLLFKPAGGPAAVVSLAWQHGKIGFGPYDWNFTQRTCIVVAINGLFYYLQKYSADQTMVQRYLIAKTDRGAIRAALAGGLLCVPVWTLFMFVGSCLWSFYKLAGPALTPGQLLPAGLKSDQIFPFFIATELPVGVTGLVLAALVAAGMSALSSDMNCLSAVVVEDYYRRLKPAATERQRLRAGKWAVLFCGLATMAVAWFYLSLKQASILGTVFGIYSAFSGGIAGLFVLGFFFPRANHRGVLCGIAACILFTAWAMLTSPNKDGSRPVNLGLNYSQDSYMLGVYSHFVLFGVGLAASWFFPANPQSERFTIYAWLARRHEEKATQEPQASQK